MSISQTQNVHISLAPLLAVLQYSVSYVIFISSSRLCPRTKLLSEVFINRVWFSIAGVLRAYIQRLDSCFIVGHIIFASCFDGLVKFGPFCEVHHFVASFRLISQDPDDF